jgi:hypothetical protein
VLGLVLGGGTARQARRHHYQRRRHQSRALISLYASRITIEQRLAEIIRAFAAWTSALGSGVVGNQG